VQLEAQTRQFLNLCVARARAHARQQFAAEIKALRAEMQEHVAAVHRQLAAAREEAAAPREYYEAHRAHAVAKQEVAAIYRKHMIERAMEVEFDPLITPLQ
jgi:hypothetical protein